MKVGGLSITCPSRNMSRSHRNVYILESNYQASAPLPKHLCLAVVGGGVAVDLVHSCMLQLWLW